ncbi:MAG: ABC transporter ATP-binding protein [Myxococcaceae bacterium]|nr:ABC transporter ATP-binding protein [Myxococcaceae bacterium]
MIDVHKWFGTVHAVQGLTMSVQPGECVGFLGPNGAGKTTSLEMIEGLQQPTSGTIRLLGKAWDQDAPWLRQQIGLALQETRFEGLVTIEETVDLFRSFYDSPLSTAEVLETVRLSSVRKLRVNGLSGGQRQRLALAVGLVGRPQILFLDEPTSGLDPQSRKALWGILAEFRAAGRTIVLTTHYMDEVEQLCSRILVVNHGKVIANGTASELRAQLGGRQLIEVGTSPGLTQEQAKAFPGVVGVSRQDDRFQLMVDDARPTLAAIVAWASRPGQHLLHLAVRETSLDDVFIGLTRSGGEKPTT